MEYLDEKNIYIIGGSLGVFISVCIVILFKNNIYKCFKKDKKDINKMSEEKSLKEIKIDYFEEIIKNIEIEITENISNKKKIYCTHCGHKFIISEIPIIKMIECDKCYKIIHLPKNYYKITSN